ncbi:MAG: pitrilysin family protein, partial [Thermoanaerobaculia bacterium]
RLLIPADQVEPERGAVLAEMHGYENDPSSVLHDAVLMMSFLQHPYRNNTIGWESDVESIQHADIVDFYERYYQSANAVLVVVGDISVPEVQQQVDVLFGPLAGGHRATPPPTVEPLQRGVRRLTYEGTAAQNTFKIAYRAPAVNDSDYVAFLVLQDVLAGGSGVNFSQNEWGDAVRSGARMDGTVEDLVTWFIPTAAPYVFTLGGRLDLTASSEETEARIEAALAGVRDRPIEPEELEAAKQHLLRELVFDVETTEDAAHQLAFFAGLDGLEVLLDLPNRIASVTPGDAQRVAQTYLRPEQRTIGWYVAGEPAEERARPEAVMAPAIVSEPTVAVAGRAAAPPSPPKLAKLSNGLPVLFQRVSLSPTAYLRILVPTTGVDFEDNAHQDHPFWRQTSLDFRFRAGELQETLQRARSILVEGRPLEGTSSIETILDPGARLSAELDDLLGADPLRSEPGAAAVALVGDLDEATALAQLEKELGDVEIVSMSIGSPSQELERTRVVELDFPIAQAQLGYVVAAPPPSDPVSRAWRLLLYSL